MVVSLLLNYVRLQRGEALYLPAGNLHAYLRGVAVEVMATSDNVLRGGLTPKHVDIDELLSVTNVEALAPPLLTPRADARGVTSYDAPFDEFRLRRLDSVVDLRVSGLGTVFCEHGEVKLGGLKLYACQAAFVAPGEDVTLTNRGTAWLVTQP